jgi:sugar phosphate isomerase/epimerase
MGKNVMSRRSFALAAAVGAGMARTRAAGRAQGQGPAAPGARSIRLGAPVFLKTDDPEELALLHRKLGYRAAYCPENASLADSVKLQAIVKAFEKHQVVIAEVGRWVNLLDADPARRRENLQTVTDGLALADALGAICCVDIAGSFNSESWFGPHPDNLSPRFFDAAVENARRIIDAVKPRRTSFCYEMMGWSIPDSADAYLELLRAVDRPNFAVHLDPCNLVNSPSRFYYNAGLINEAYDKLGRWIVSAHAKDLTWDIEMNIHFREVPPGAGEIDYRAFLDRHAALPHRPPLMLEHLRDAAEYDRAREFIFSEGKSIGISFGS